MKWSNFYIFRIEFLGFRFHGWQFQPDQMTVQGMIDKTFKFLFKDLKFKTLGAGRTDSMVSAKDFVFELFTQHDIQVDDFLELFNENLPTDIRLISITETDATFNIIQSPKIKTYTYHFGFGGKQPPFTAPLIYCFRHHLDIEVMTKAAELFEGEHNFRRLTCKPTEKTILIRSIKSAKIYPGNSAIFGNSVENYYIFEVQSSGFLRYQVRMMMAALLELGGGHINWDQFKDFLNQPEGEQIMKIAPKSGLRLEKIEFL